jgi:agmatinase
MPEILRFADANAEFSEARFVVFGVPFDRTSSFRMGSRSAPNRIREESHNFESYMLEHRLDLCDIPIHDAGNLEEFGSTAQMTEEVEFAVREMILKKGKFMLMLGGEHSITPTAVKAFKSFCKEPVCVLSLDAHLDFRASYLDETNSHACALRRSADIVGVKNVASIGIRSMSREESEDIKDLPLNFITSYDVAEKGINACLKKAVSKFGRSRIYLTLDIDCIDPAYAPGTGTPEPFGLTPMDVKHIINAIAPRLAGFDLVEVCPPYDNGNTSALAARIAREVIAAVWKAGKKKR